MPPKLYHYSAAHLRPAATSSSYAHLSPSIPAAASLTSPASGPQLASSSCLVGTVSPDSRAATPDLHRPARHSRRVSVVTPQTQRRASEASADSAPGLGETSLLAAAATVAAAAAASSSSIRLPAAAAPQLPPSISTYLSAPPSRPHGMRSTRQTASLPELHGRSSRKSQPLSRSGKARSSSLSGAGGRETAPRLASVSSLQALRLRCCTADPIDWNRTISQDQLFGDPIPPMRVRLAALTTAAAADASGVDLGPPLLELFHPYGDDEPPPLLQLPPRLPTPTKAVAAAAEAASAVEDLSKQELSRRARATARAERRKPMKLADRPLFKLTGSSSPLLFSEVAASRVQAKAQLSTSQLATLTRQEWDGPPSTGELLRILQVRDPHYLHYIMHCVTHFTHEYTLPPRLSCSCTSCRWQTWPWRAGSGEGEDLTKQ